MLVAGTGWTRFGSGGRGCGGYLLFVVGDAVAAGGCSGIAAGRGDFHLFAQRGFQFFADVLVLTQEEWTSLRATSQPISQGANIHELRIFCELGSFLLRLCRLSYDAQLGVQEAHQVLPG